MSAMILLASLSPEITVVGLVILVLFVASLLAMAPLQRFHLPFTVALMLTGLAVGVALNWLEGAYPHAHGGAWDLAHFLKAGSGLTPEIILFVFLPPLVFESAYALDGRELFKNLVPIIALAVPVLVFSTVATGAVVMALGGEAHGLNWPAALLFGALISATDPVAVVALFKQVGAPKRLGILVEGESLCNDGTAIVLFNVLLAVVVATLGEHGLGHVAGAHGEAAALDFHELVVSGLFSLVFVALGGVLVGVVLARAIFALIGRDVANASVQVTLSVVLAYASFVIAEHFFHVSGVMASVSAGLVAGSYGKTKVTPSVEHFLHGVWEYLAFTMNSLIFFFVGLVISRQVGLGDVETLLPLLGGTIGVVLVIRAVGVFGTIPVLNRFSKTPIHLPYQTVLWWGGLRGAVSLALALTVFTYVGVHHGAGGAESAVSLPQTTRTTILVLTAGVVMFTLLVNAMSMPAVMSKLKLDQPTHMDRLAAVQCEHEQLSVMAKVVERLEREQTVVPSALTVMKRQLKRRRHQADEERAVLQELSEGDLELAAGLAAQLALSIEKRETMNRFAKGALPEAATKLVLASSDRLLDLIQAGGDLPRQRSLTVGSPLGVRLLTACGSLPLLGPLARRRRARQLGLELEAARALFVVAQAVAESLKHVEHGQVIPADALTNVQTTYARWRDAARERFQLLSDGFPDYAKSSQSLLGVLQVVRAEAENVHHLEEEGLLTPRAAGDARTKLIKREEHLRTLHTTGLELDPQSVLINSLSRALPDSGEVCADEVGILSSWLTARTYEQGELVLEDGEAKDVVFVVSHGWVEVVGSGPGGQPQRLRRLGPGAKSQALAELGQEKITIRALTPVNLLELRTAA